MSIPWSFSSRSFVTARACCAASSHSSAVFSISGLNTKMCSCISVRPRRLPSTGPCTVLTWTIASPSQLPRVAIVARCGRARPVADVPVADVAAAPADLRQSRIEHRRPGHTSAH